MILREPTPAEVCDIVAINHLAASYSEAISRGDVDEAVLVYADNGVLCSATTDDAVGRAQIASVIKAATAGLDFVFQTAHLGLVEVDGDSARARVQITEWARRHDGRGLQFLGWYDDIAVRTPAGWRYARRELVGRTLGRTDAFSGRIVPVSLPASLTRSRPRRPGTTT